MAAGGEPVSWRREAVNAQGVAPVFVAPGRRVPAPDDPAALASGMMRSNLAHSGGIAMPRSSVPRRRAVPRARGEALQQVVIAGTLCGVLSAAYHAWLLGHAPDRPMSGTSQTIRLAASFHGRHIADHFVSPGQLALWWALSLPAAGSLVVLIAAVVWMGIRSVRPKVGDSGEQG